MPDRTRLFPAFAVSLLTIAVAAPAFSQSRPTINLNCGRGESLATAAATAYPNTLINIKGACTGPINIATNGVQINGVGTASINGGGKDTVTVTGAQRVTLSGLSITGGGNGLVAQNGAQVLLQNDAVEHNTVSGIVALANSSITVNGGGSHANSVHGLDIEASSSLAVTGSYVVSGNGVFGINVNNESSLSLQAANLTVTQNTLGIQLGTNASGFLDGQSILLANENFSDGITIVSGSHVVDFGGTIQTLSNAIHGISLNSKAGLDLDAGSQVTSEFNQGDGVHMEQNSELSIFNNPTFSGNPNATLLNVQSNLGNGIDLLSGSRVMDDNFALVVDQQNGLAGIAADDGSSVSFGQTIPVSNLVSFISGNNPDIKLSFGSHFTFLSNDAFTIVSCDATSLIRGPGGFSCPR
jgi:hypothetical protein